jgi:magnesium transporter
MDGLGDAEAIKKIGELFNIHPLALEDVVSTQAQRPKLEEYDEALFIIARMPVFKDGRCPVFETEQLGLFLTDNVVLTFQEVPGGDPFLGVRERIRKGKGKIRSRAADYLSYAIVDALIDSFFPVIDERSDEIELVETDILERPNSDALRRVHTLKQELISIRRALWPLREVLNSLIRDTSDRITDETKLFLRDCYDHTSIALDLTETYRELCSDLTDMYLSNMSNKMNEVMKFLTMTTTIFVPLTFIVGVYGMNFEPDSSPWNMPELRATYGYPAVILFMIIITLALISFFRRKGWM